MNTFTIQLTVCIVINAFGVQINMVVYCNHACKRATGDASVTKIRLIKKCFMLCLNV